MAERTVLITGSGRGLGRELALVFAENGYNLILNGRNEKNLREVQGETSSFGIKTMGVYGDIRDQKTINELVSKAYQEDISVLINNAGAPTNENYFENLPRGEIEETIETNLISPIKLMRGIYPLMKERERGTIININSMIGLELRALKGIGCAARWGLRGFTESLKEQAKEFEVNILDVYPTRIMTKPEYEYGYNPRDVAEKIFESYLKGESGPLILDGRKGGSGSTEAKI